MIKHNLSYNKQAPCLLYCNCSLGSTIVQLDFTADHLRASCANEYDYRNTFGVENLIIRYIICEGPYIYMSIGVLIFLPTTQIGRGNIILKFHVNMINHVNRYFIDICEAMPSIPMLIEKPIAFCVFSFSRTKQLVLLRIRKMRSSMLC